MGRNVVTGLMAVAIAAIGFTQVMIFTRLQRLQEQVVSAPRDRSAARAEHRAASPDAVADEAMSAAARTEAVPPAAADGTPARASASRRPVTADEVEGIVQRAMKDRDAKSPNRALTLDLGNLMEMGDPLAVMERELQLSPSQKLRIQEHMKARDEAIGALWKDGGNVEPKKWQEIHDTCEESVKRELDYAQQQKYEELQKSGKLFGGGTVVFHSKVVTPGDKK